VATRASTQRQAVTIDTRDVSDYKRLELYRGLAVPDFAFQDLDGQPHRLVDFRGRFVLINVWYPGCGPCLDQFPYLRVAADRFGPNDLVILGWSPGYPREGRLKDVSPASPPAWIEAEPQSVRNLIEEWLQITAMPTPILLDRDGRVLVLNGPSANKQPLSGDDLVRTLERYIRVEARSDNPGDRR
jgi:thiol-disulfide isomerase/thioredoxin